MAVTKINGFRAPYRSETFREIADAQAQRNGVMKMDGVVSQTGSTITIPAFAFIQQGLLVNKDVTTTLTAPAMTAPFYVVVSAPTSVNTDDLIFSFAKSPSDISSNEVLIASYDGLEWRPLPLVSFDGVYDEVNQANIDFGRVGPFSGANTSYSSPNYLNEPGVVVDKQGLRQTLTEEASFAEVIDDPDGWNRVDRVIYRRPKDSENRIGVRKFLTGGSFDTAPGVLHDTQILNNSETSNTVKVLTSTDSSAYLFTCRGYGNDFKISFTKLAADRTTVVVAATDIVTGMTTKDFDVTIDASGNFYVVYVVSGNILWRKFGPTGIALTSALVVDTQAGDCGAPRIAIDPDNTKTYIVYQSLTTPTENQIFFTTRDLGGGSVTGPANITNDAFNNTAPSLFVTDDFLVYVAWEDTTSGKIKYRIYDDIGVAQGSAVTVSSATERIGFGTLVDGAKKPKIWVTDNKNTVIAFLQDKGGLVYGLSVWTAGAAKMQQLFSPTEDILEYDLYVDPIFNGYHLAVVRATSTDFVKMRGTTVDFSLNYAGYQAAGVGLTRDPLGSIIAIWSEEYASGFTSYDAVEPILYIGATTVTGGINNANLANDEFLVSALTIAQAPKVGDRVIITGSGSGNNGTYGIIGVTLHSLYALNDRYIVKVDSAFATAENPAPAVNGDFQAPDGNESRFIKNTAETQATAYSFDELDTDLLLTRIVRPGPIVLNYPSGTGGGSGSGADVYLPYGASVTMDWEATSAGEFTIAGGLKILDMLNNFTYNVADGGYALAEGEALYVELDGANFSITPQITLVQNLPWSNNIRVLGVIKDGEFNPHLLDIGMGQLDSGESIIFGEDLSDVQRARLGITGETTFEAYSSIIGFSSANVSLPDALSQTNIMAGQNKHVRLVRGWVQWANPTPDELEFVTTCYVQVPGVAENRNQINPQVVSLASDGDVAYVEINRTAGAPATLTVNVASIGSLSLTRNTIILFRRVYNDVVVEATGQTLVNGKRILLGYTRPQDERAIHNVKVIDLTTTVLPTGAAVTIDGTVLVDGDKVLFTQPSINAVYQVRGIGTAAQWTQIKTFGYSNAPSIGDLIRVEAGTSYLQALWTYDATLGWRPIEGELITKEPTGFPNRTDSDISFDDGTRTFTIAVVGTYFDYFIKGKPFRKETAQTVVIPDTEGLHYIYFNGETLVSTTSFSPDILRIYAYVATIYWDATNKTGIMVGDERHGMVMDAATHSYLHNINGTQVRGGLAAGDFTIVGTGAADADCELSISNGKVIDEDIEMEVVHSASPTNDFEQILDPVAEIPVYYRDGASGLWRKDAATTFPLKQGTARIKWNQYTLGSWHQTDVTADGYFTSMWLFATNNIQEPIIAILGQAEWSTLADAQQNDTYETLLLGGIPSVEMKVIYRLIFETNSSFTNTPKASLRDVRDLRTSIDTGLPAYAPADHGLLTGLTGVTNQDHDASAIYTDTALFNRILSAADDDLQKSLDTLDNKAATSLSTFQDRSAKLIKGGTWAWDQGTNTLNLSASAYVQLPGVADNRNEIAAGNITLSADGQVAWVSLNRTAGAPAVLTVTSAANSGLVETDDKFVIARRVGNDVLVGRSFLLKDKDYLELDGALSEVNRRLNQLKIYEHESAANKIRIAGSDITQLSGDVIGQELNDFLINDSGSVVNFTTGVVLEDDDSTPKGINFTPFTIPVGEYFWYGLALIPAGVDSTNRSTTQVQVTPASASNASQALAPYPVISGDKKLGAVQVRNNAGSIEVVAIHRLGVGSGSGGGGTGDITAIESALNIRLSHSDYALLTPNDFKKNADDYVDDSLAPSGPYLSSTTGFANYSEAEVDPAVGYDYANTFTLPATRPLNSIDLVLSYSTAGGGQVPLATVTVWVEIYATTGGFPTGPALATSNTKQPINFGLQHNPSAPNFVQNFTFPTPPVLTGGTQYAFVLKGAGGNVANIRLRTWYTSGNDINPGERIYYDPGSSGWFSYDDGVSDSYFVLYAANPGEYSLVSKKYEMDAGEGMATVNLLDENEFLDKEKDVSEVEIHTFWDLDNIDTAATYEVSRDGGDNWQTVDMERVGETGLYTAKHGFSEEPSYSTAAEIATTDGVGTIANYISKVEQAFTLSQSWVLKEVTLFLTKTGSPQGNLYVGIARDVSGDPGEIVAESLAVPVSTISSTQAVEIPAVALPAGTYHIVTRFDQTYSDSYVGGVHQIQIHTNSTADGWQYYDTTIPDWVDAGPNGQKYTLKGRPLDLRLRVTASATSKLDGFGVLYDSEDFRIASGDKKIDKKEFLSITDNDNEFTLGFLPDPDLLKVFCIQSGQVFRYPLFQIDGYTVRFPVDFFLDIHGLEDDVVTLFFDQTDGTSFDNSDQNANDIIALKAKFEQSYLANPTFPVAHGLVGIPYLMLRCKDVSNKWHTKPTDGLIYADSTNIEGSIQDVFDDGFTEVVILGKVF